MKINEENGVIKMYTCIYCKKEKDDDAFNREHVIPRMMGRYINALVLSNYQICQECNSYFSKEIEDKILLDSYEAFLRMKSGIKKIFGFDILWSLFQQLSHLMKLVEDMEHYGKYH